MGLHSRLSATWGDKAVRDIVLADPAPFRSLADGLEVKDVRLGERRYVVCRNPAEAERDARMRAGILDRLRTTLRHGPKAVVGCTKWTLCVNRGFARFLRVDKGAVAIDAAAIEADARFDGVFVLRTNTDQPADEVARLYKGLWQVEDVFKTTKALLATRPIFHKTDAAIRGHVFISFLALVLRKELIDRLAARRPKALEWQRIINDLANLTRLLQWSSVTYRNH